MVGVENCLGSPQHAMGTLSESYCFMALLLLFYLAATFENPNDAGDAFAIEDAKAKQRSNVSYTSTSVVSNILHWI